mmetsp:Transcript_20438/g.63533  ORF Transcript_20438/g.63533 Transcript_20438/m.63533 type:complete len:365 (-) Transcript_20438:92-1186(-)
MPVGRRRRRAVLNARLPVGPALALRAPEGVPVRVQLVERHVWRQRPRCARGLHLAQLLRLEVRLAHSRRDALHVVGVQHDGAEGNAPLHPHREEQIRRKYVRVEHARAQPARPGRAAWREQMVERVLVPHVVCGEDLGEGALKVPRRAVACIAVRPATAGRRTREVKAGVEQNALVEPGLVAHAWRLAALARRRAQRDRACAAHDRLRVPKDGPPVEPIRHRGDVDVGLVGDVGKRIAEECNVSVANEHVKPAAQRERRDWQLLRRIEVLGRPVPRRIASAARDGPGRERVPANGKGAGLLARPRLGRSVEREHGRARRQIVPPEHREHERALAVGAKEVGVADERDELASGSGARGKYCAFGR